MYNILLHISQKWNRENIDPILNTQNNLKLLSLWMSYGMWIASISVQLTLLLQHQIVHFYINSWRGICASINWAPLVQITVSISCLNSLRQRKNRRHFADNVFKCNFLNENVWIPIKMSLKFVPKGPINNIPALVQKMAWRQTGDKPLSEPMMTQFNDAYMLHSASMS